MQNSYLANLLGIISFLTLLKLNCILPPVHEDPQGDSSRDLTSIQKESEIMMKVPDPMDSLRSEVWCH